MIEPKVWLRSNWSPKVIDPQDWLQLVAITRVIVASFPIPIVIPGNIRTEGERAADHARSVLVYAEVAVGVIAEVWRLVIHHAFPDVAVVWDVNVGVYEAVFELHLLKFGIFEVYHELTEVAEGGVVSPHDAIAEEAVGEGSGLNILIYVFVVVGEIEGGRGAIAVVPVVREGAIVELISSSNT